VLEALKDQEQARRKNVRNAWCSCWLREGQVPRQMLCRGFVCLWPCGTSRQHPGVPGASCLPWRERDWA